MHYFIIRTDRFYNQLFDIISYIANAFSKKEAEEYLNYIGDKINSLSSFPYIGVIPRYQALSKQGYRALICRQNIIFYKVDEKTKTIILYAIVPAKSNYLNLI